MLKIGVIANNSSKINAKNRAKVAALKQFSHKLHRIDLTTSLDELEPIAKEYLKEGVQVLAICGGDGTISRTLTAFVKIYQSNPLPAICLLGGGTANVLAQNLGFKSYNPTKNIQKMLNQNNRGVLNFNRARLRPLVMDSNVGFLFADGFVVGYLEKFYANKNNMVGASLLAIRLAISGLFNGLSYRSLMPIIAKKLVVENKQQPTNSLTTFVSVVDRLPTGIKIFSNTMSEPNMLTVLDFSLTARQLVWALPLIIFYQPNGVPFKSKRIEAKDVVIEQKKPWKYTIDGEIFDCEKESLSIKLGPMLEFYLYTK